MMAHTPTPWRVDDPNGEFNKKHGISGFRPIRIKAGAKQIAYVGDDETDIPDAAFIVLAVNSHDALIEALRFARANFAGGSTKEVAARIDAALALATPVTEPVEG